MRNRCGYVYFVRGYDGLTKVGYTRNLQQRLQNLQVSGKQRIRLIAVVKTATPTEDEHIAHGILRSYRVRGEWFRLDSRLIRAAVRRLKLLLQLRERRREWYYNPALFNPIV